jgi:hypothetical protein
VFREGLAQACRDGVLSDGKLMVRLREEGRRWTLEHVLVTIQQTAATAVMDVAAATLGVLRDTYASLQDGDGRWCSPWQDVATMINPNGPMVEA